MFSNCSGVLAHVAPTFGLSYTLLLRESLCLAALLAVTHYYHAGALLLCWLDVRKVENTIILWLYLRLFIDMTSGLSS